MADDLTLKFLDELFLRYPHDDPRRLLNLTEKYLEFRERLISGVATDDPFSLPMDPLPVEES